MWKYNVVTIRPPENATSFTGSGVMPLTDKSRYFRLAVANYERADAVENPKLKAFTCQLQLFRFRTHIVLVSAQEAGNFSE